MTLPDGSQDDAGTPPDAALHAPGTPKHDVFVSYSTDDKPVAHAIVSRLEQSGIRCWIAPRDVIPGQVWAEAIINAIDTSRLMVVVLSGAANESHQVVREVERAVAHNVVVIPFRIESILPTGAMAYYLASEHWLDALTPPLESHIAQLVKASMALLERPVPASVPAAVEMHAGPTQPSGFGRAVTRPMGLVAIGLGAIAVSAAALLVFFNLRGDAQPSASMSTPTAQSTASATVVPSEEPTSEPSAGPSVPTELDWELPAYVGEIELAAGFAPDPHSIEVMSGGSIDVSYLGSGCVGYAAEAPDYDVSYEAGSSDLLRFYFVAESGDTVMIISGPDGSWYCADDSFDTTDPTIDFAFPESGLYDIWIGSSTPGAFGQGTLYVTELESQHP